MSLAGARSGVFRRRVRAIDEGGIVRAGVEDDFHHYEIEVFHRDGVVTQVAGWTPRTPFDTCVGAAAQLSMLKGVAVATDVWRRRDLPDPHFQCTHMYELALFAIAQAARGGERQIDITVPDRVLAGGDGVVTDDAQGARLREVGLTRAEVAVDGFPVLAWDMAGLKILPPSPFSGFTVYNVGGHAARTCDDETLEAVKMLRRGLHVSMGRTLVERLDARFQVQNLNACYVFQAERIEVGKQTHAIRDFTDRPEALLSGAWQPED